MWSLGYQALYNQQKVVSLRHIIIYVECLKILSKNWFGIYFIYKNSGKRFFRECFVKNVTFMLQICYFWILFIFLYWIFKGLARLILCFLLKRIDLALSSRKWMLRLLSCKISIAKNSNQHYNHQVIWTQFYRSAREF